VDSPRGLESDLSICSMDYKISSSVRNLSLKVGWTTRSPLIQSVDPMLQKADG
jgi:hypothetical protein